MTDRREGDRREKPAWVQPLMEWSAIEGVKARLNGPAGDVPTEIGGVEISNAGRQLLAWWLEARGSRAMPDADDVSPRALVELLPYIRYLSWEDEDRLVFRIFGSALAEAAGVDLAGYDMFAFSHDEVGIDKARLKQLHDQPCGIVLVRDVFGHADAQYPCEFMTLPIAPGPDGKKRIIGTIVPVARIEEWTAELIFDRILTLRRAVYFDTGAGVPDPSLGLEV
ncbi:PAS domain-containing protein [Parvibaculum sp.]|uniref:PAS domain-containing protein n=1 Tax=Parvibaculum sp. TaxID=2024848 RepID=UPI003BAA64F0